MDGGGAVTVKNIKKLRMNGYFYWRIGQVAQSHLMESSRWLNALSNILSDNQ